MDLLLEAKNTWELKRIVKERIEYYNKDRTHLAIDYLSPINYLKLENILPKDAEVLSEIGA